MPLAVIKLQRLYLRSHRNVSHERIKRLKAGLKRICTCKGAMRCAQNAMLTVSLRVSKHFREFINRRIEPAKSTGKYTHYA